jgi:hypothetical protein
MTAAATMQTTDYFECLLCGNYRPIKKSQRIYRLYHFRHPALHSSQDRDGKVCSACYSWDFDVFRRGRTRKPLKLKDGSLLTAGGFI